MANEYTALQTIHAPGSFAAGYQRGDAVTADVVGNWDLVVGEHVCEGDLVENEGPAPMVRPGPEANRATWEAWAVANGMSEDEAAEAQMEDLEAAGPQDPNAPADPDRPADSARKADWVDYAVGRGLDQDTAEGMTKAELQEWQPEVGDPVALAATEANQA